ncbi:MAG TPA: ATP-binding protein, partial [Nitrospiria bacterium]|nr:ATP-binding protein [Nitrospiria bacterium]
MSATNRWEVPTEELCVRFDPEKLPFESTEELRSEEGIIGQERAVRAMDFGLHMGDREYNIYVSGVPGTGKNTIVKSMILRIAETQPTPDDWCYVNNFQDPDRPKAISLPAGKGREFQRDMSRLITSLREEFPKVFQSQEYQDQLRLLEEAFSKSQEQLTAELEARAKENGFMIESSRLGIAMIPLYKGKPVSAEQMESLPSEAKEQIKRKEKDLHSHVHNFVQKIQGLREAMARKIEALNQKVAQYTSEHAFESLMVKYKPFPKVLDYIRTVRLNVLENFKDLLPSHGTPFEIPGMEALNVQRVLTRYAVNVVVDNGNRRGAPLIEEVNPTYNNLVGRIEKRSQLGVLYTDFTLIKAGSLLQANGGFLLMNVLDVLRNPFSWEAIKRVIKNREIKIEDIGELYGAASSSALKPEPIPVQVRLILVGNPLIYYLLHAYDEDFGEIFKVKADFDVQQKRTEEAPLRYARFIARLCRDDGLLHFDRGAVAVVLDQVSRWADHQKKLSLCFSDLADLIREAAFWAKRAKRERVSAEDVKTAVKEKIYRSNLLEERIQELIAEGTLMVDVDGEVVGQVNGLSVYDLGDFTFGRPSRITSRVFLGRSGIVNIEREAKLSGRTHSKGVLILSGCLGGRYARKTPLSLSATLCFEQSYGEVEGDSASAAELLALLSCLSDLPIRQGIAVTGSINQRGEFQAIGGVNEKIEGFHAVCKELGMTGRQGVIIPRQNVKNLMLKEEVVESVGAGKFHIYAVSTVDEALEIVTGRPAGALGKEGSYP